MHAITYCYDAGAIILYAKTSQGDQTIAITVVKMVMVEFRNNGGEEQRYCNLQTRQDMRPRYNMCNFFI